MYAIYYKAYLQWNVIITGYKRYYYVFQLIIVVLTINLNAVITGASLRDGFVMEQMIVVTMKMNQMRLVQVKGNNKTNQVHFLVIMFDLKPLLSMFISKILV